MASNSGVQQHSSYQHQHQQQLSGSSSSSNGPTVHQCKECGISMNSAKSLAVHIHYHEENLLKQWAVQAAASTHGEETNNNNMTKANNLKSESIPNNTIAPADSSDMQKKSPEYKCSTPENMYGHPPTPQSYQSASSPYQSHDNSAFSPNFPNFQIKTEAGSPASQQPQYQHNTFSNFPEQNFFPMENNQQYNNHDVNISKSALHHSNYRFVPYTNQPQLSPYERPKSQAQVPSSSPAYPPQPTPSPSPKQCDKCGCVCESAAQLIEHINLTHPPTPAHPAAYSHNQHFMFDQQQPTIKTEEDASQSEILDLDSHKVVHQVFPEDEKRPNGDHNNPHSVTAMLNQWSPQPQEHQQQNMFSQDQALFMNNSNEQKLFQNIPNNIPENKMFAPEQKLFQPMQMNNQNFMNNGVTSTNQEIGANALNPLGQTQQAYRPFEHLPSPPSSVISSTQANQVPTSGGPAAVGPPAKSGNWKSNEARRPKTYNCTACNKWFTSSGHLKRHYNTTLHKNAVKSSGHPDPASLPISAHHHPSRDSTSTKPDERSQSNSPREDSRGEDTNGMSSQFERLNPLPGLLQQPPNGPYDRQQPPNLHHSPMPQHPSPLGQPSPLVHPNFPNIPNGSPPNGEAGLSPNTIDSRGLLSISSTQHNMNSLPHGFNMMSHPHQSMVHPMENTQFQMYPNESAPHVTQAMAISSPSTTGEFQFTTAIIDNSSLVQEENQPLPSFAQIQGHRFGVMSYGIANVGGGGTATTPFFYTDQFDVEEQTKLITYPEEEYKLTVLSTPQVFEQAQDENMYSPSTSNNNNDDEISMLSEGDTKTITFTEEKYMLTDEPPPIIIKKTFKTIKKDYEENTGSPLITSTVPTTEKLNKCYKCDKMFNKPCYLTQHNKTCHNGDKPFRCPRCGKRFSSEDTYREHMPKHAGEKPHKCDICPKQFNHKTDLRRHMCCHTGRKPYTCETCGKGFIRKDHMVKHMETHVRKSQSKANAMRG